MFLLERKQQMLIFFWSSSSELWAIGGRFLLAGTKRSLALIHSREMVVQRRLLVSLSCSCCPPADLLDEQGEGCWAAGSPRPSPCCPAYSQSPFPSLPSHTGTRAAFSSLMENHSFARFWSFVQIGYQSCSEWRYLKRVCCLESRLPLPQARLGRSL